MKTDNVHPIDIKAKLFEAVVKAENEFLLGEKNYRELSLVYGRALLALREEYPADREFSKILDKLGHRGITDKARTDSIWLARLSDDARESAFEIFPEAITPSSLRNRVREALGKDFGLGRHSMPTADEEKAAPAKQPEIDATPPENDEPPAQENVFPYSMNNKKVIRDFFVKKNAGSQALQSFNKSSKQIKAFADLIRTGKLGDSNEYSPSARYITPRFLFNDYPARWNPWKETLKGAGWMKHADEIIDHHQRCAGDMSKNNCAAVWKVMGEEKEANKPTNINMEPFEKALSKLSGMPETNNCRTPRHVEPIVFCGQTVWKEGDSIAYNKAWQSYALCAEIELVCSMKASPESLPDHMLKILNYIRGLFDQDLSTMWQQCWNAQRTNPEEHGDNHAAPPAPRLRR